MNKEVKREIIAKFRDKLEVTQHRPEPPEGMKQVDESDTSKFVLSGPSGPVS